MSRREFPSPASGLTSAVNNSAGYIPEATCLRALTGLTLLAEVQSIQLLCNTYVWCLLYYTTIEKTANDLATSDSGFENVKRAFKPYSFLSKYRMNFTTQYLLSSHFLPSCCTGN
jgi:hypothetical protein